MAVLKGLNGVKATEVECEFIRKPSDIETLLKNGKAATAAGDHGAINIYKDDEGIYRTEAMRNFCVFNEEKHDNIQDVLKWYKKYKAEITHRK